MAITSSLRVSIALVKNAINFPGTGFFFLFAYWFSRKKEAGPALQSPIRLPLLSFHLLPALALPLRRCAYPHKNHLHQKKTGPSGHLPLLTVFLFSYHGSSFSPGSSFITSISPSVKESGSPSTLRRLFSWRMRRLSPSLRSRQSRLLTFSA